MGNYIDVSTPGGSITFEVDKDEFGTVRFGKFKEQSSFKFVKLFKLLDPLNSAVREIRNALDGLDATEIELSFSLKLDAEVGFVISKGATDANFTVRAKWTR
jgi:hypothetical protein